MLGQHPWFILFSSLGREEGERRKGRKGRTLEDRQTLICACRYYHFDLVGKKPPSHETRNKNYFLVHCASFFAINFVIVSIWSYYLQLSVTHLVFNKYVCVGACCWLPGTQSCFGNPIFSIYMAFFTAPTRDAPSPWVIDEVTNKWLIQFPMHLI